MASIAVKVKTEKVHLMKQETDDELDEEVAQQRTRSSKRQKEETDAKVDVKVEHKKGEASLKVKKEKEDGGSNDRLQADADDEKEDSIAARNEIKQEKYDADTDEETTPDKHQYVAVKKEIKDEKTDDTAFDQDTDNEEAPKERKQVAVEREIKEEQGADDAAFKHDTDDETSGKTTFLWSVVGNGRGERLLLLPKSRYEFWKRVEKLGGCKTWGAVRALGPDVHDYARDCIKYKNQVPNKSEVCSSDSSSSSEDSCDILVKLKDNPSDDEDFPAQYLLETFDKWMACIEDNIPSYPPIIERMMAYDLDDGMLGYNDSWFMNGCEFDSKVKDDIFEEIIDSGDIIKEEPGLEAFDSIFFW